MQIKFDSLNRFEEPQLTLCNPGSTYSNGAPSKAVAILPNVSDVEFVFNFNSPSELNFRITRVKQEDETANEHVYSVFKAVQNRRMIFVKEFGYFIITDIEDGSSVNGTYKDVKATSVEYELQNKKIPYIADGTYRFSDDAVTNTSGLLQTITAAIPLWTIGNVDSTIASKYRTFEDVDTDTNCLGFMLEDMQDAYECIFIFDTANRIINVYDQANYVVQTDIHISKEDLINELSITENSDDVYTAINVLGDGDLTISAINPLGTNVIYNFDYYLDWMSDELKSKVSAWQTAVANAKNSYYNTNLQYYTKLAEASSLQSNLDKLDVQLTMYNRCRENIVAESSNDPVADYNAVIVANGGTAIQVYSEIADTLTSVDNLIAACEGEQDDTNADLGVVNGELQTLRGDIETVHDSLAMDSYFTQAEYEELANYIYEASYTDQYVTVTDIMTHSEQFEQMKILYDRAEEQLKKISEPTREFDVDVENFVFAKDFEEWSDQLETGCLINVELDQDDVAMLFLSRVAVNYEDCKLRLTFGNRFNKYDTKSLFENVLGKISKSANSINYMKDILYPVKQGQLNVMEEQIQASRDITMGNALSATDEQVLIDGSGYTGRKYLSDGTYDPQQVKIVGKNIVFTDDAWQSSKLAIGEIILGEDQKAYGINGEIIIGDLIMGNNLRILDSNGNDLLTVVDGMIQSQVTEAVDNLGNEISTSIEQTANNITVRVDALEEAADADEYVVKSTGYRFDKDGLKIFKSGEEIHNELNNTGMYVTRTDEDNDIEEQILVADAEGVNAINLTARQYLTIGSYSRFEDYSNGTDTKRTACFYIG